MVGEKKGNILLFTERKAQVDFSRRLRLLSEPADFEEMLDRAKLGVAGQGLANYNFSLQHFRFYLEPKAPLLMSAYKL